MSLQRADRLGVVEEPGRVVAVPISRRNPHPVILEGTAASIWHAIDGERSVEDVTNELAQQFGMAPEEIAAAVSDAVKTLAGHGLLREEA